jgi:uncharacterized membrane protein YfcA
LPRVDEGERVIVMSPEFAVVLVAAFGAGVVDAMVGGGGLIQLPALFAIYPQAPPPALLGTSKFAGICGTANAAWRFSSTVQIPWRALLPLAILVFITSALGAFIATLVPQAVFRPLVPIMLLTVLIYLVRKKDLGNTHAPRAFAGKHHTVAACVIAAIGFYDGFFGPGTGSFLMFVFVRLYGYDFVNAAASARVLNVATNASALLYFSTQGYVLWEVALAMAVCNVIGATLGSKLAIRGGSHFVRKVFIVVVLLLVVRTAWVAVGS